MQPIKLTAASPGVRVGTRSLGKRVRTLLRASNEGGQASVEFALLMALVLLPFFVGIITVGVAFNQYLELTDAVSIGARVLAISRGQTNPCQNTATAVQNVSPFLTPAKITLTILLVTNASTGATTAYSGSGSSVSCPINMVQGSAATLTATYPCNFSIWGTNFAPNCTMTAQTTEVIQ